MSYCRGEVYAYRAGGDWSIKISKEFWFTSLANFEAKLIALREAGFDIPDSVFERIAREKSQEASQVDLNSEGIIAASDMLPPATD